MERRFIVIDGEDNHMGPFTKGGLIAWLGAYIDEQANGEVLELDIRELQYP